MCHDIRAWKMMWHHHRHSRIWFWLQNSGHKNLCIWVNAGSISFNFDPTSICTISVFLFQNPREPPSPFSSCRSHLFPFHFHNPNQFSTSFVPDSSSDFHHQPLNSKNMFWRFEEVWGFEKLGFVDLDCFRSPKYRYTFSFWLKPLKSKHSSIRYKHVIRKFVVV
ncbi:hypothetical protein Hdeb2414_s0010g00339391 [Helianthus debilis subsp. tardiflorus]